MNSQTRDSTAVHSAWKTSRGLFSLSTDWDDDVPESEKRSRKQQGVEISKRLAKIVGKDGGTYINEANPYELDWKQAFWGNKYDKLERIKSKVDPQRLFVCNRCVGGDVVYKP